MIKPTLSTLSVYKTLLSYVKPYKTFFLLALFGNLLYGLVDAGFIYMFKPLLDKGFVARDQNFISMIPYVVVGIFLLRGVASFMSTYFMGFVGRSVVMRFRQEMFQQLLVLPTSFYDKTTSGELLAKITYNVEQVADACTDATTVLVRESFTAICLLAVMLMISWKLTILFIFAVPLLAWIMHQVSRRLRRISISIQDSIAAVTHVAEEAIEGQKVIKAFGGQAYEQNQFDKATHENRHQEMKLISTSAWVIPLVQLVGALVLAATVYLATVGPDHAFGTALSTGDFASMISAMIALLKPVKLLTKVNTNIQKGIAGASSIFSFLLQAKERDTGKTTLDRVQGTIEYRNVNFQYESKLNQPLVVQNVSFKIKAGEILAIVGRSGSGKSTLVNLLPRFYESDGSILIDGLCVRDMPLAFLRKQISLVSQHVVLFNDTLYNNIAYGAENVSKEQVIAAADSAHALEFIEKLPEGFETVVGENGVRLSGGQRQRLAIARAILKRAPILILDEATSSLDTESERKIQDALVSLMAQSTTMVIAHRLSTIENADRIIVMDAGKILEMGTHQELSGSEGLYAALRVMQYQDKTAVEA